VFIRHRSVVNEGPCVATTRVATTATASVYSGEVVLGACEPTSLKMGYRAALGSELGGGVTKRIAPPRTMLVRGSPNRRQVSRLRREKKSVGSNSRSPVAKDFGAAVLGYTGVCVGGDMPPVLSGHSGPVQNRFELIPTCDAPIRTAGDVPWLVQAAADIASPYSPTGRLLALCDPELCNAPRPIAFFELGPFRVVRAGPRSDLEVFWVDSDIGFGVRALCELESGEFVCEYAGEVLGDVDVEAKCCEPVGRDAYLFDLTTPSQWAMLGAIPADGKRTSVSDDAPAFVIDAFARGNIGRFLNHACGPSHTANVTPVFVFTEDVPGAPIDARLPRVGLFTNRSIEPGEELRYDYDMRPGEVGDEAGGSRSLQCRCGSNSCRGWIY